MASAPGQWAWMAAVAAEELAKLEAAHPGRLGPLKDELRRLVAEPGWDDDDAFALACLDGGAPAGCSSPSSSSHPAAPADLMFTQGTYTVRLRVLCVPSSPDNNLAQASAVTINGGLALHAQPAESSTNKRKWCGGGGAVDREQGKRRRKNAASGVKDRADMAIDRAKKCLKKIRAIKRSLLACVTD